MAVTLYILAGAPKIGKSWLSLVTADFHRRKNKKGVEYGMPVSVLLPPEAIWGYNAITAAYVEEPAQSWERICNRVKEMFPRAEDAAIIRMIGKCPEP